MSKVMRSFWIFVCTLLVALSAAGQKAPSPKVMEKLHEAEHAYATGNMARAEKLARDVLKEDPQSVQAHALTGDLMMVGRRFLAAAQEYTAAIAADKDRHVLDPQQLRSLKNQQGSAYGLSGSLDRAQEVLTEAIQQDPDYPLFHYNLACVYAEKKQLDTALEQLRLGWKLRENLPQGETFPDPRKDSSFAAYLNDPRFQDVVREMVF